MKKKLFSTFSIVITRLLLCGTMMNLMSCAHQAVPGNVLSPRITKEISGVNPELLVQRLTWGINASSVSDARKLGVNAYLQQQLSGTSMSSMPQAVQDQLAAMTINKKSLVEIVKGLEKLPAKNVQKELNRLAKEAQSRAILRALYSPQQLQEQLCWFWLNHFNVFQGKANIRAMVADYEEQAIRPHALGKFPELLTAITHHPAMLRYLNNAQNVVNKPDQSYARALMELHTMGVDGDYTQHDIQELARVLTGVGFNLKNVNPLSLDKLQNQYVRNGLFEFDPRRHDYGDKEFLGHRIQGGGLSELDEVINLLSRHPATAHFISKKLALFFVSDTPSSALVESMAQTFLSTQGDIQLVLKTLFSSSEFINSLGKQFKDPQHFVLSALRLAYDNKPISTTQPVINWLSRLGQPRYEKLTPEGYALRASAWNNAAQMTARFDIAKIIGSGKAELFKKNRANSISEIPKLNDALYAEFILKLLSQTTVKALDQAKSPQEWNTVLLKSPEMMLR